MRLFLAVVLGTLTGAARLGAAETPNVIVVLADDLGHSDLGCQGNTFHETPHLDRLAADGVRFTTAYSACTVCSPTRAALLTGQYPARLRVTDWIAGHKRPFARLKVPDWTMRLPAETYTLAEAFTAAGYATASVGKWHLGGPDSGPEQHGFGTNIGGTEKGSPGAYFPPYRIATLADGAKDEHLSDRLTREACGWIAANKDKPFFLYLPHYAVHTPLGGKPAVVEKYRRKAERLGVQRNAVYAALVESLDDGIGALRAKLAELKLTEKTVIIFTSDNGGLIGGGKVPITTNPPFRAGKGSAYEGGVRVPLIVYWPGVLKKPGPTCDLPVMTTDIFPTLDSMLALPSPNGHRFDGRGFSSGLTWGPMECLPRSTLYWHYPHYHPGGATPYSAVRVGPLKLIEFFEDDRVELYDLKDDPGETRDLARGNPERVRELRNMLAAWRKDVGAQLPTPNPDHDPARANQPAGKK